MHSIKSWHWTQFLNISLLSVIQFFLLIFTKNFCDLSSNHCEVIQSFFITLRGNKIKLNSLWICIVSCPPIMFRKDFVASFVFPSIVMLGKEKVLRSDFLFCIKFHSTFFCISLFQTLLGGLLNCSIFSNHINKLFRYNASLFTSIQRGNWIDIVGHNRVSFPVWSVNGIIFFSILKQFVNRIYTKTVRPMHSPSMIEQNFVSHTIGNPFASHFLFRVIVYCFLIYSFSVFQIFVSP